jgi:hypothetical protein
MSAGEGQLEFVASLDGCERLGLPLGTLAPALILIRFCRIKGQPTSFRTTPAAFVCTCRSGTVVLNAISLEALIKVI